MWVREEQVEGKKLSEIINSRHENVKYLPGVTLPKNVVAEPDLFRTVEGSTVLVVVVPHQVPGVFHFVLQQRKHMFLLSFCSVLSKVCRQCVQANRESGEGDQGHLSGEGARGSLCLSPPL